MSTPAASRRIVDLSHPIEAGMVTYPGLPVPEIHAVLDRATSAGRYAPGVTFQIDLITLCGTPAPTWTARSTARRTAPTWPDCRPERLVDLPAVRIDVTGIATPRIDARRFRRPSTSRAARSSSTPGSTGSGGPTPTCATTRSSPATAVELLVGAGAALVGIDSLNIDSTTDRRAPAHSLLLGPASRSSST